MSAPARRLPDVEPDDPRVALGEVVIFHRGEWTEDDYTALPQGTRAELHAHVPASVRTA